MISTLALLAVASLAADEVPMKFIPSGAAKIARGYVPKRATMLEAAPDSLKKSPEGLVAPKYGTLEIESRQLLFILDESANQPSKLFVDTNGDGDLTNDPATTWSQRTIGSGQVELSDGQLASIGMYQITTKNAKTAEITKLVMYYPDYGHELTLTLDGKTFSTLLTGDARPLWIDRDHNELRSSRREMVTIGKPFNFTGTTYVLKRANAKFTLEKATESLPVAPMPPDLRIGKTALPFEMVAMDGAKIDFPKTYAGKLVMLDFWATWCGPCIAELPNVKKAYEAWHDKGFEILSISFDQPNFDKKLKTFIADKGMPWGHIYEGKLWSTSLGEQYDVSSIPFVLLVDGDSGEILGTAKELRGPGITAFIEKQLTKKNGTLK